MSSNVVRSSSRPDLSGEISQKSPKERTKWNEKALRLFTPEGYNQYLDRAVQRCRHCGDKDSPYTIKAKLIKSHLAEMTFYSHEKHGPQTKDSEFMEDLVSTFMAEYRQNNHFPEPSAEDNVKLRNHTISRIYEFCYGETI